MIFPTEGEGPPEPPRDLRSPGSGGPSPSVGFSIYGTAREDPRPPLGFTLDFEKLARLFITVRPLAVFARCDAGEAHDMAPTERRAGSAVLLGYRPVVLFGVQRAVFARSVLQHEIEARAGRHVQLAVSLNEGRCQRRV